MEPILLLYTWRSFCQFWTSTALNPKNPNSLSWIRNPPSRTGGMSNQTAPFLQRILPLPLSLPPLSSVWCIFNLSFPSRSSVLVTTRVQHRLTTAQSLLWAQSGNISLFSRSCRHGRSFILFSPSKTEVSLLSTCRSSHLTLFIHLLSAFSLDWLGNL